MNRQEIGEMLDKERSLKRQVGGDHYRRFKIQPVEFIIANGIGFLAGNIIKYVTRYPFKGGAADIRKIIHYCELILEFEYGEGPASAQEQAKVRSDNPLRDGENHVGLRPHQEGSDAQRFGQEAWISNHWEGY